MRPSHSWRTVFALTVLGVWALAVSPTPTFATEPLRLANGPTTYYPYPNVETLPPPSPTPQLPPKQRRIRPPLNRPLKRPPVVSRPRLPKTLPVPKPPPPSLDPNLRARLQTYMTQSGPTATPQVPLAARGHQFRATGSQSQLLGNVWFQGHNLVVNAMVQTKGGHQTPQGMTLLDPNGNPFGFVSVTYPETGQAGTEGSGSAADTPNGGSKDQGTKPSGEGEPGQGPCSRMTLSSSPGCSGREHPQGEPPVGPERAVAPPDRVITRKPPAAPEPPPPGMTRFQLSDLPCPRRLKGWSIGATVPGAERPESIKAVLDEPPGAFVRTMSCQVLVVMTTPPGTAGGEEALETLAEAQGLSFVRSFALPSINTMVGLMEVSGTTPLANFFPGLQAHPQVAYAQPNHMYQTSAYNDPLVSLQYGPQLMDADRAHQVTTGRAVSVAVIDTAIDSDHPDLKGKVVEQIDLIGPDPPGLTGVHGTLMSGVIGATENNELGIYGVAPDARIVGLKACQPLLDSPSEAACSSESIARALDEAIRRKIRVINMSLGGPADRLVEALVSKAAAENIVVVAAAGNEGPSAPPSYPAAYGPVIAVSAIDLDDEQYDKANVGPYVDLTAPGVNIISTMPGERFSLFSGTSMATAHVSAVAALLIQAKPDLSLAELTGALEGTAVDLGQRGRDPRFGAGRVNACRALERLTGQSICP